MQCVGAIGAQVGLGWKTEKTRSLRLQKSVENSIKSLNDKAYGRYIGFGEDKRVAARVQQSQRICAVSARPGIAAATSSLEELCLDPISVIEGHVKLPGSKSLSNRVLLLAALAEGTTVVENILVRGMICGVWRYALSPYVEHAHHIL